MIKDWYTVRTQLFLSFCIFLLPNLYLILSAATYDPPADLTAGLLPTLMAGIMSVSSIICCTSFMVNTVSEDVQCGWTKYVLTASVSRRRLCGAKILNSCILVAGLSLISFLINLFAAERCGSKEIMLAAPICTAFFQFAVLSPVFPLAMRFGAKKATVFYIAFLILGIGILVTACVLLSKSGHIIYLRQIFYIGIPAFALISAVLSIGFGGKASEND